MIGQGTRMDVMSRMDKIGREANPAEWATCGLKVQLQDETGRTFAGFGAEDCEPIVEDALDAPHALERLGRRALVERQNGRAPV